MIVITKKGNCTYMKQFRRKGLLFFFYIIRNIIICDEVCISSMKWL